LVDDGLMGWWVNVREDVCECVREFGDEGVKDLRSRLAHDFELTCDIIKVYLRRERRVGG
jgi:hypothetical protein